MQKWLERAECLALFGSLAVSFSMSQSLPPQQESVMGRLASIGNTSVSIDQNGKALTLIIGPTTELWRHGTDLRDASQLVLGEDIRATYSETEPNGPLRASLVVQSEPGDTVQMVPHQVVEHRLCSGNLIDVTMVSLTVRTEDDKTCTMQIDRRTEIWHGKMGHDPMILRLGDEISSSSIVRYPQGYLLAEKIWIGAQPRAGMSGIE